MFQKLDEENKLRWTPFSHGLCFRKWIDANKTLSAYGEWDGNIPDPEKINTVTCREYAECWSLELDGIRINDIWGGPVSKSCEPFPGLDSVHVPEGAYGCKR